MPLREIFRSTPRADFFVVFPSGFFMLLVLALNVNTGGEAATLWSQIGSLSELIKDNPVELIIVGFASYLFGNILRAFPVGFAEKMLPGKPVFPYSSELQDALKDISKNAAETGIDRQILPDLSEDVTPIVYNYWKDSLCINCPEAFEYYQRYESRARFFVSMFFSGIIGFLGSIGVFLNNGHVLSPVCWHLLLLSLFMIMAFGAELKYIRRQETTVLLLLYVSYLQNR